MLTRIVLISLILALSACANSDIEGSGKNNLRENPDARFNSNGAGDGGANLDDASGQADFSNGQNNANDMGVGPSDLGPSDMSATDADAAVDMPDPDPCANDPSSQGWEALGGPLDALGMNTDARGAAVTVDESCRPIVAFHQGDGTNAANIFVYRWESGAWNTLGGAVDGTGSDTLFTTAVHVATHQNTPYIAWAENEDGEEVYVARWDGSAWQQVGNIVSHQLLSFGLGFDIDSMGRPVVTWAARLGFNMRTMVYVARYENMSWVELDSPLVNDDTINTSALGPELVIDAQDRPIVMWQEANRVHARRWEANNWNDFVGNPIDSGNGNFSAFQPVLDAAPSGAVVMGWRESTNQNSTDVFVQSWDGSFSVIADSVDVEPETNGRTNTLNLALAVDGQNRTVFAFDEPELNFGGTTNVQVFRHDQNGLAPLGMGEFSIYPGDTSARSADLAVDQVDRAVLAFEEDNTDFSEIHVWRYTD